MIYFLIILTGFSMGCTMTGSTNYKYNEDMCTRSCGQSEIPIDINQCYSDCMKLNGYDSARLAG